MTGAARKSTARFEPNNVVIQPNESEPITPPRQLIEPTHEIWSLSSGCSSGVVAEAKIGNAGDTHPVKPFFVVVVVIDCSSCN